MHAKVIKHAPRAPPRVLPLTMKSAIANQIAGSQDVAFGLIMDWLVQASKGFGYCYVGNKTGKKVTLTFPPAELHRLIVND